MTTKKHTDNHDPEVAIESAINKTEDFIQRNTKTLLTVLAVVVVIVGGYFAYKYLYVQPQARKAADQMYVAEQQFAVDSFALALNGDGNNAGFLEIADNFGSTAQGNLAAHYAGVCYMHLGDYDNALTMLGQYSATDGVPNAIINAQNYGLRGDIMVQKSDYKKALEFFEKAVKAGDNSITSPYYLKKAGIVCEKLNDNAKAIELYTRIKEEFSASMEARDIDKSIGRANQK